MSSSETAAGVNTPISVNSNVIHFAGVKSMLICSTTTFAGSALARSLKLRLTFVGEEGTTPNDGVRLNAPLRQVAPTPAAAVAAAVEDALAGAVKSGILDRSPTSR